MNQILMGPKETRPLVTVVTAVHNTAKFLQETISSVVVQDFIDWEMILVDDCSDDNSVEIIERISRQEPRIKLIKLSRNSGAAVARNAAIEAARGRYISFLDSDDLWKPEKLTRQIHYMQSQDLGFTYTHYERISEDGRKLNRVITAPAKVAYKQLLKANVIGCLTAVYDAEKLGKIYMPKIRKRQDYGLWLEILKHEKYAYCLPENLALYRVRNNSISSNKAELIKYNWQLYRKVLNFSLPKSVYYLSCNIVNKVFS